WLYHPKSGGSFPLIEGIHGFAFAFKGLKDGQQLGDLQQVADALREVGELDVSAGGARRSIKRDQSSQAAAIDVADASEVDDDVRFAVGDQSLHQVTKSGRFVAKHDASVAGENCDSILIAGCEFQIAHRHSLPSR